MKTIPQPIFRKNIPVIFWKKIYEREYGVQYSEMAILCLSPKASYHIPSPSVAQIVIPSDLGTAFYIDGTSWVKLVESLNISYTSHIDKLEQYEKDFLSNGKEYVDVAKKISKMDLKKLSNSDLKKLYDIYYEALFSYSVFAWTSFILNNHISERATTILDVYLRKNKLEQKRQDVIDSLFEPTKLAAILLLQKAVGRYKGNITSKKFEQLYESYKWLSCLDIHNNPWTKEEFRKNIEPFKTASIKKITRFEIYAKELKISSTDMQYLLMAKRFVYIKDARDDFRRYGVFLSAPIYSEITRRMKIHSSFATYLTSNEIRNFLDGKININNDIEDRRLGFVMYLSNRNQLVCLNGKNIQTALKLFRVVPDENAVQELNGMIASRGSATGKVIIIRGVKDLHKVKAGNILVAVTTHPDFVPAMRKATAIITDEGGITSHAAIIAREFGIPCIVGTKSATKILKDGDTVSVDAMKGTITKT